MVLFVQYQMTTDMGKKGQTSDQGHLLKGMTMWSHSHRSHVSSSDPTLYEGRGLVTVECIKPRLENIPEVHTSFVFSWTDTNLSVSLLYVGSREQ